MLCAGIAAAGGNCVDAAAWSVVAGIGSSKRMEGVSAVSANSPRYRGCCGCRARRAARRRCPPFGGVGICRGGVVSRLPQQTLNQNPVYIKLDPYMYHHLGN